MCMEDESRPKGDNSTSMQYVRNEAADLPRNPDVACTYLDGFGVLPTRFDIGIDTFGIKRFGF